MNRSRKVILFIGVFLSIVLFVFLVIAFLSKHKETNEVKVKENVSIITTDTEKEYQPIQITDDTLVFNNNPGYEAGDVIVAGIIDITPNGFIRKVVDAYEENGKFVYETEYAVLTDVFEEAHIVKTFVVTNEEVRDVEEIVNAISTPSVVSIEDAVVQTTAVFGLTNASERKATAVKIKPSEKGLGVIIDLDEEIGDSLEVAGQVEVNIYFEIKIDIEDGEIDIGMAMHTDTNGEIFIGYQEELFDKDNKENFNGEYEIELIKSSLPNIQFLIGSVPVVITNDFMLSVDISAQVEGQIGTTVEIDAERVSGFEYSSKTGMINEISEEKYLADGMNWETSAKATGELEVGIYAHLITKLYGSTGTDISIGIAGDIEGELVLGVDEKLAPILCGKLAMSIGPKIFGKIVVTVPVVDYNLVETEIFKVSLPAFWEKEWEVLDPLLLAMKNGNFSAFAGSYVATPEDNNAYGGGQELNPLFLNEEGILSGGHPHYSEDTIPKISPVLVEKCKDGSYYCEINDNCYFIIYPVGVIENREYVIENQFYLKDTVYIYYVEIDGGVFNVKYYLETGDV